MNTWRPPFPAVTPQRLHANSHFGKHPPPRVYPASLGAAMPAPHHLAYRCVERFESAQVEVRAVYVTTGPAFRASYVCDIFTLTLTERNRAPFELTRQCYLDISAQVAAYNAVTRPIPND